MMHFLNTFFRKAGKCAKTMRVVQVVVRRTLNPGSGQQESRLLTASLYLLMALQNLFCDLIDDFRPRGRLNVPEFVMRDPGAPLFCQLCDPQ
ncbi:hypothetical protein V6x_35500 [Gimesia chilikensis]|uniref:Uncharacterized protein n=1 Tax=Gimesia chilikensis TaxID=2605989 RepID=A0A517WEZ3_9PLAN|nr:hypothetical protein V6x_35500 [Gimesia chilikensis]